MSKHILESKLRPAVEFYSASVFFSAATLCVYSPWAIALAPSIGLATGGCYALAGAIRFKQGLNVVRYRQNLKRLPIYEMTSSQIPVSNKFLFMGRGFEWTRIHTQRLMDANDPNVAHLVEPSSAFRLARYLEKSLEDSKVLSFIPKMTQWDSRLNPIRPLPPVGGSSLIHGVEPNEKDVYMPLGERVGHTLVVGTTRVGKTRLAEVYVTQDIHRGDVTIMFDPKGDADLLKRMYVECKRAGREKEFYVFHLGYPDISARYNAVGRFGRISEVAGRISGQLSGEGNSAAFREFAWRFVNIIAKALVELGRRPDYTQIARHVVNIDELFIEYAKLAFERDKQVNAWEIIVEIENKLNDKNIPMNMRGRDKRVVAVEQYISQSSFFDPVMDGLRSAVRYDRTYFDKIVASLLPLLEKLTTGKTAELLAPNYADLTDPRPIFDWMQVIRKKGVVYVGLDAMSDAVVASAVGNSMFADLVSVAGQIYKHGIDEGLPGGNAFAKRAINLHADEFNELMGDEFIPLINKGGGAGMQVTAYTQTISDIEARIGNAAKAGQVVGNFNTLQMLRVRETKTAELLTKQLPKVNVLTNTLVSGATDTSDPSAATDFTSSSQDRVSATSVPMIEPAHIVKLPKGQMFSLQEGGQLWKVRMPLPKPDPDDVLPDNLQELAAQMRKNYNESAGSWWSNTSSSVSASPLSDVMAMGRDPGTDFESTVDEEDSDNSDDHIDLDNNDDDS
ncbi:type IV conjugative transfer system coupling protein TraD [Pseudomonas sp. C27(2019)]|uniref:type IV conjugative transfer system coupling protein TraD n=1 Tax=Pseudomonas sp. C27(2019) TaxID=2604941 RepID=UPI001247680D|nr:type IV conjugative transfer system coupling protein TraD [Pseudomonas sp. C27(2019)]QEY57773.1 type IV conjugative transfer system coupling protein TraD [Pseudomonas sp. C27(2019)]